MRQRGRTIQPRQLQAQQKENHADRRAFLPSGDDAASVDQLSIITYYLPTLPIIRSLLQAACLAHPRSRLQDRDQVQCEASIAFRLRR